MATTTSASNLSFHHYASRQDGMHHYMTDLKTCMMKDRQGLLFQNLLVFPIHEANNAHMQQPHIMLMQTEGECSYCSGQCSDSLHHPDIGTHWHSCYHQELSEVENCSCDCVCSKWREDITMCSFSEVC